MNNPSHRPIRHQFTLSALVFGLVLGLISGPASGAAAKPKIAKEKQLVLDWLGKPETVEKFGKISDAIWSYAELGLQEFKSSKLLADTLEAGRVQGRARPGRHADLLRRHLRLGKTRHRAPRRVRRPAHALPEGARAEPGPARRGRARPRLRPQRHVHGRRGRRHRRQGSHGQARHQGHDQGLRLAGRGDRRQPALHDPGRPLRGRRRGHRQPQRQRLRHGLRRRRKRPLLGRSSPSTARRPTQPARPGSGGAPWTPSRSWTWPRTSCANTCPSPYRMHYVILEGGEAPNVVPDKASVWYYVRNNDQGLEDMYERVVDCAKAGALASGTELASMPRHQRRPPAARQQGRGRAHPEEHRARRHARLDRGGAGLRQGPAEGARGRGRKACRPRSTSSKPRSGMFVGRRLLRRRRRDPDRPHGDDPVSPARSPGRSATTGRPSPATTARRPGRA